MREHNQSPIEAEMQYYSNALATNLEQSYHRFQQHHETPAGVNRLILNIPASNKVVKASKGFDPLEQFMILQATNKQPPERTVPGLSLIHI